MTHYIKSYEGLEGAAKQAKAIEDIKSYLGVPLFKKIAKAVHADQTLTRKCFIFQLSMFVGIEGYPANAWADELGLVQATEPVVTKSREIRTGLAESGCNTPPEA